LHHVIVVYGSTIAVDVLAKNRCIRTIITRLWEAGRRALCGDNSVKEKEDGYAKNVKSLHRINGFGR
jgi:hypothetical protein